MYSLYIIYIKNKYFYIISLLLKISGFINKKYIIYVHISYMMMYDNKCKRV